MSADSDVTLSLVLDEPLSLQRLTGSGAEQAPELTKLLNAAGLRTSHQSSPPGVLVYLVYNAGSADGGTAPATAEDTLLRLMCGLDGQQDALEARFQAVRRALLARRLCARFRMLRPQAALDEALAALDAAASREATASADDECHAQAEATLEALVREAIRAATRAMGATELQLSREWQRLLATHSSLANACLARFCETSGVHLQDGLLVTSAEPSRVRLSLLLYDKRLHEAQQRPRFFAWVPALSALMAAPDAGVLATLMTARLWRELQRQHYQ